MQRHIARGFLLLSALLMTSAIGAVLAPAWHVQQHWHAQQRWLRHHPDHYRYEVKWIGRSVFSGHWLVEVQHGRITRVINLTSGRTPSPWALREAPRFVLIDELFDRIKEGMRPVANPGEFLVRAYPETRNAAMYAPAVGQWLDPHCWPAFPIVRYDEHWGYPVYVKYRSNACYAGDIFREVELYITGLQLLP